MKRRQNQTSNDEETGYSRLYDSGFGGAFGPRPTPLMNLASGESGVMSSCVPSYSRPGR